MALWGNIALFGLKMILQLIPIFFSRSAQKAEYERLVKASIYIWEKRVGTATKLRKDHQRTDELVEKKWKERWGVPPPPEGQPEIKILTNPIFSGKKFIIEIKNVNAGLKIYADKTWIVGHTPVSGQTSILLTSPGKRTLDILLSENNWFSINIDVV